MRKPFEIPLIIKSLILVAFCLSQTGLMAQVEQIDKQASPLILTTTIVSTDDFNPTLTQELNAYGVTVSPKGKLVTMTEGTAFLLDYEANLTRFRVSDAPVIFDDSQSFNGYRARLLTRFFMTKAWNLDAEIQHKKETIKIGEGISRFREDVLVADEVSQNKGALRLIYGNDSSERFIALKLESSDTTYEENNPYSSLFDYRSNALELEVAFSQSELTKILFKLTAEENDFKSEFRDDSDIYEALLGLQWRPTGLTNLKAYLGMYRQESVAQESDSGLSWLLELSHQPRRDWLIEINSARSSDVSISEISSTTVTEEYAMTLSYLYSQQWQVGLHFETNNTEFVDDEFTSELDEKSAWMELGLAIRDHSKVTLRAGRKDVETESQVFDYQQNELSLTWQHEF